MWSPRSLLPILAIASALSLCAHQAFAASASEALPALGPTIAAHRALRGFAPLTSEELKKIDGGQVLVRETPAPEGQLPTLQIAAVLDVPVQALYLVLADLDDYGRWNAHLTHNQIVATAEAGQVRYALQFVSAPYPAQDRGWVSEVRVNSTLYQRSGGQAWELWWTLAPEQLARVLSEAQAGAMALPTGLTAEALATSTQPRTSDGGWLMVPLGDGRTYLEYAARMDPAANLVERGVLALFGARMQRQMFEAVGPAAAPFARGQRPAPAGIPDIGAGSAAALVARMPPAAVPAPAAPAD